jgi:hypothetical protein
VLKIRRRVPVDEYLRLQRRYAHLFKEPVQQDVIDAIQAIADRNIRRFDLLAGPDEGGELPGEATDAAGLPESQPGIAGRTEEESNLMRLLAETHHGAQ